MNTINLISLQTHIHTHKFYEKYLISNYNNAPLVSIIYIYMKSKFLLKDSKYKTNINTQKHQKNIKIDYINKR